MESVDILDFAGVGVGPANLSLAALCAPLSTVNGRFFERSNRFLWHPDFLFQDSLMQTSFLKDLVTPVDPTSKYSFLAFLVAKKRFYQFLNASFQNITRAEFCQYLAWVAERLPNLEFGAPIRAIEWNRELFELRTDDRRILARDIVLGTGRTPSVPDFVTPHLGDTVLHSAHFGKHAPALAGRRVAVIGGGQSSAELMSHLLQSDAAHPSRILWISRRSNFLPLDESPFANEWFTPEYSHGFYGFAQPDRARFLDEQKLASDGISRGLLEHIYQRLYTLELLAQRPQRLTTLLPMHELVGLEPGTTGWRMAIASKRGQVREEEVDLVLLATGYEHVIPACMEPLRAHLRLDQGDFIVREDFSIEWDGPESRRIFVQNAARRQRGIADPNLSLVAWRSAIILNSLLNEPVYPAEPSSALVEWQV